VDNDDSEGNGFEIVLVFELAIGGDEYITLQLLQQHIVFQMLPAKIKECSDVMSGESFYDAWVDGGVYDDAHDN
jgi:hypothetical protein